jgi:hypothetical protein
MINRYVLSGLAFAGLLQPACAYDVRARVDLEPLIIKHATANSVPAALVHRIIIRESRYNPRAVGRGGAMGLMQIKHGTARALGYAGPPAGLLDADTNLTYGVRYLAGAYRVAGGDQNRAVGFYARGYYYDAKRRGMLGALARGRAVAVEEPAVVAAAAQPQQPPSIFDLVFSPQRPAEPVQEAVQTVEEPQPPVPPRRSGRSAKQRVAAPNPSVTRTAVQTESAVQAVRVETGTEVPLPPRRATRSVQRHAPMVTPVAPPEPAAQAASRQATAQPIAAVSPAEPPVRRSGRSAKRPAASGANRSAQKASEPPGDPGRFP